jgi:hypothetical protein
MIYGSSNYHMVRDVTDLIGIRSLILRKFWTVPTGGNNPTQADVDAAKPDAPTVPGRMMLMGEQTMKEKGRYATLWTFQGIQGDGDSVTFKDRDSSIDYGFDPGFSQVPIQVHKNFLALMEKYEGYPSNDGTVVIWPPEISGGGGGGSGTSIKKSTENSLNPMFGIQAFFEMDGIYRFRYAAKELPTDIFAGVGLIAQNLPGKAPELKEGRDWIMATPAYQRKGYVHDITEYYWMSRRGGWPKPIYSGGGGGGVTLTSGLSI